MFGIVKQYDRIKGFGFILPETDDPTHPEVFCFARGIDHSQFWRRQFLLPGMRVEFQIEYEPEDVGHDRPCGKHVQVVAPVVIAQQTSGRIAPKSTPSPDLGDDGVFHSDTMVRP